MHNHFNRIKDKYFANIGDKKKLYNDIKKIINPIIKDKIILDIGSGGHIFYDYSLSKKTIILDVSIEMLNSIKDEKLLKINEDARNITKINDGSIDLILIIFTLHHINGKNYKDSIASLEKILKESFKKLKIDGELLIIEPILNKYFFIIEKILYKFIFILLNKLKTDMVFFYNENIIKNYILSIFKKSTLKISTIKINGFFDPLLGTFPGLVKIPAFLMPTSMKVFYIKKLSSF